MADPTDAQTDAAIERGRIAHASKPRAVVVDLTNGCTFMAPPQLAQGLEAATDDQLAEIEILGAGYGLHWEALDVDLSIPGLLGGIFGRRVT